MGKVGVVFDKMEDSNAEAGSDENRRAKLIE